MSLYLTILSLFFSKLQETYELLDKQLQVPFFNIEGKGGCLFIKPAAISPWPAAQDRLPTEAK